MRKEAKPYLSFILIIIFITNCIPSIVVESREYQAVSGNILDMEAPAVSENILDMEAPAVLEAVLDMEAPAVSGNIKDTGRSMEEGTAGTASFVRIASVDFTGASFMQDGKVYYKPEKTIRVGLYIEENTMLSQIEYAVYDSKGTKALTGRKDGISSKPSVFEEIEIPIEGLKTDTYSLCITAVDINGSCSEPQEREFHIDGTSPKIEINHQASGESWYRDLEGVVIEAEIGDELTFDGLSYGYKLLPLNSSIGPDEIASFVEAEKINPDDWISPGVSGNGLKSYTVSISVNEIGDIHDSGSYALLIWAKDGCQNESEPESYVFHYDKDEPSIKALAFQLDGQEISSHAITGFGNFFNKKKVEVSVQTEDGNHTLEKFCKGMGQEAEEVCFYYFPIEDNESQLGNRDRQVKIYPAQKLHKNGAAFLAVIEDLEEGVPYRIFLSVKDKAGNTAKCELKDIAGYKSSLVMVDEKGPEINFKINDEFKRADYTENIDGRVKEWYRSGRPVTFTLTVKDFYSGLSDWQVFVNGEKKWNESFRTSEPGKDEKQKYSSRQIDLSRGTIGADGHYTLEAEAHDNAGNSSDSFNANRTIYIDGHAPVVTRAAFSLNKKEYVNDMGTSPFQYSFFFKKPINMEVTATDFVGVSDNPGSGVKSFRYYFENTEKEKVKEGALTAYKKRGSISTFTAKDSIGDINNFKGRVFISAMDNTGNESGFTGSDGIVIESEKEHKRCSKATIKMADTPFRDANGNPLYNKMPVIGLETSDSCSGIAKNVWKLKALASHASEAGGSLEVQSGYDEKKEGFRFSQKGDGGWTFHEKEKNLVTRAGKRCQVESEKNSLEASLKLTDNAGHEKKAEKKVFSVDVTPPRVFVEYDNNEAYNEKFYNKERYATIHVIDANFSREACEIKTTGPEVTKSEWEHIAGSGCNGKIHAKDCEYICRVGFVADGDYTFGFECTDLAGFSGSYGQVDDFTIDLTKPVIQVSYDNEDSRNGSYFKAARTATIQIEEHNFSPEDVSVTITAMDGGASIPAPALTGWTQSEDIHTALIAYDYDGEFTFSIEYTDLANNQAEEYTKDSFIIDVTEPEIEISGIRNQSANKGKVQPVITCKDTNLEDVAISLKGVNRGTVQADYDTSHVGNSMVYKLKDMERLEKNDDIYTMHVMVRDKAGNELEQELSYSINRFGSVYEYDKQTEELVKAYYSSKCDDLLIKEVNVNTLKVNRVTYSKDGEIVTLKEGKDYKLSKTGDELHWKEYNYTIYKENFEEEGKYILTLYSEDQADNQSDNRIKGKDIEFVIDKTAPSLVLSGVTDGGQYQEDSGELVINAEDNVGLAGLKVYNDGMVIADFDGEALEEANGTLRIPLQSKNDWQRLLVVAKDMAGNESSSEAINYLMTKNLLVQWYKNTWFFYGSIVIVLLLAGIAESMIRRRKGQKKKRMGS